MSHFSWFSSVLTALNWIKDNGVLIFFPEVGHPRLPPSNSRSYQDGIYLSQKILRWFTYISVTPYSITQKKIVRLHGTQNDQLEPTIPTQKSVLKNIDRVPRYQPKCVWIQVNKPNLHMIKHFGSFLSTRWIFFKTDFCVETMSSSRSFWAP